MGLIKEPKNVDFIVQSEPWTEEELKDFRILMNELKSKTVKEKFSRQRKKGKSELDIPVQTGVFFCLAHAVGSSSLDGSSEKHAVIILKSGRLEKCGFGFWRV